METAGAGATAALGEEQKMITYTHSQLLHMVTTLSGDELRAGMKNVLRNDVDTNGIAPITILGQAAKMNRFEAIPLLKRAGANLDLVDKTGWSPAMHAVAHGKDSFVYELHRAGARLDVDRLPNGSNLLHVASHFGRENLIAFLGSVGVDPSARNDRMQTPAHHAAANLKILQELHKYGGAMDEPDVQGDRPLHLATRLQAVGPTAFLLSRGAVSDVVNVMGESALQVAMELGGAVKDVMLARQAERAMSAQIEALAPRHRNGMAA